MIKISRILVPTDFSDTSEVAVRYAAALARSNDAALHVLHVLEEPLAYPWGTELYMPQLENLYEQFRKDATERLPKLLTDEERRECRAVFQCVTGNPYLEIMRYASDHQVDLIVIGTHGRTGATHLLMGSVAEKVVRRAPCPVLTVRNPQHEFVLPDLPALRAAS